MLRCGLATSWNGRGWFLLMSTRKYSNSVGVVWRVLQNGSLQDRQAVQLLREDIGRTAEMSLVPIKDSRENMLAQLLCYKQYNQKVNLKPADIKQLHRDILRNRISQKVMLQMLDKVVNNDIVSISVPQEKDVVEEAKPKGSGRLHIHAHRKDNSQKVVQVLQSTSNSRVHLTTTDSVTKISEDMPIQEGDPINLDTLQQYLDGVERTQKGKREFTWRQQKKYNWGQAIEGPQIGLSAGNLLFGKHTDRRATKRKWERQFWARTSTFNKEPKELMIYSLEKNIEIQSIKSSDLQLQAYSLNHGDLFGIISNSKSTPDETLKIINVLSKQGWNLLGTISSYPQYAVFERSTGEPAILNEVPDTITVVVVSLVAMLTTYGIYRALQTRKDKSSD